MQLTFRQKIPPPLCGSSTKGSHRSSIVGFSALCGRWRYALRGILAYGLLCAFTLWCVGSLSGTWRTMFVAFLGLVHKVYACGMLAGTVIATTRVNEFLSAMARLRCPRKLTIPLAVMLRYLPTIREDWRFIRNAMRLRDVSPSLWGFLKAPAMTVNCLYVPLPPAPRQSCWRAAPCTGGSGRPTSPPGIPWREGWSVLEILRKFFAFCGEAERRKFYRSIALGVAAALFSAGKLPAIGITLRAMLAGNVTGGTILASLGVMLLSVLGAALCKSRATALQTEAGYGTTAQKRLAIAERLRYLPMGYFNANSLGAITSVTTNTMDNLSGVSTRVVMLVTEGLFSTAVMALAILLYDWRVGPSGSGKTTLCHLLSRFWDPDGGQVTLGGHDVREYSMDSLTRNFSFVFQNVYLFHDTVANNIRFGQPEAPMERVIEAAKKARCHDFIQRLPQGYETVIGESGGTLSGGERQRLSIARAMLKDAPIIILDEATANVDPENEDRLQKAIEALTHEKTVLMIAHRLKTVRRADQILVLDRGRIVQQGTHDELAREDGLYRRFLTGREKAVGWKL